MLVVKPHEGNDSELLLQAGDIVVVLEKDDSGWWGGYEEKNPAHSGWFPHMVLGELPRAPSSADDKDTSACAPSALEAGGQLIASPLRRRSSAVSAPSPRRGHAYATAAQAAAVVPTQSTTVVPRASAASSGMIAAVAEERDMLRAELSEMSLRLAREHRQRQEEQDRMREVVASDRSEREALQRQVERLQAELAGKARSAAEAATLKVSLEGERRRSQAALSRGEAAEEAAEAHKEEVAKARRDFENRALQIAASARRSEDRANNLAEELRMVRSASRSVPRAALCAAEPRAGGADGSVTPLPSQSARRLFFSPDAARSETARRSQRALVPSLDFPLPLSSASATTRAPTASALAVAPTRLPCATQAAQQAAQQAAPQAVEQAVEQAETGAPGVTNADGINYGLVPTVAEEEDLPASGHVRSKAAIFEQRCSTPQKQAAGSDSPWRGNVANGFKEGRSRGDSVPAAMRPKASTPGPALRIRAPRGSDGCIFALAAGGAGRIPLASPPSSKVTRPLCSPQASGAEGSISSALASGAGQRLSQASASAAASPSPAPARLAPAPAVLPTTSAPRSQTSSTLFPGGASAAPQSTASAVVFDEEMDEAAAATAGAFSPPRRGSDVPSPPAGKFVGGAALPRPSLEPPEVSVKDRVRAFQGSR